MEIAVVGLGPRGGNIARRLMRGGHEAIVFDQNGNAAAGLAGEGVILAISIEALVVLIALPRAAWVMPPAGSVTDPSIVHRDVR